MQTDLGARVVDPIPIRRTNAIKLLGILVCFAVAVGSFLAHNEVISEFVWSTLNYSDDVLRNGHLSGEGNNPGYIIVLTTLRLVMGLDPPAMVVLPIGIVVGPIIYYAVSRFFFRETLVALACTFYVVTHIGETAWHSVFAYAWARPLYLLTLIILVGALLTPIGSHDRRYYAAFLVPLAALPWLHYTPEAWLIIFAVTVLAFGVLDGQPWAPPLALALVVMLVVYVASTRIIYDTFLPSLVARIEQEAQAAPVETFLSEIHSSFVGGSTEVSQYQRTSGTPIYSRIRLAVNVLFAGLVLLSAPVVIKRILTGLWASKPSIDPTVYVYVGLVSTLFFHAVVYGIVFSLSTQPLIFLGPILGLFALHQLTDDDRIVLGFLTVLLLLSAVSLFLRLGQLDGHFKRYSLIAPGVRWFATFAQAGPAQDAAVLSSSHLFNYFNYIAPEGLYDIVFVTSDHYASLVGDGGSLAGTADYLAVDPRSKETVVQGRHLNIHYEPLSEHLDAVRANTDLDKIYSDGSMEIYSIRDGD